jgi:hypothetical protein
MRSTIRSIFITVVSLTVPTVALCAPLKCSVRISDSERNDSFVPQTDFGRSFSEFTLDLSRDPDQAWLHQNMCINRSDFKGARFTGSVCLIVMSTRSGTTPTGLPALYVSVWQGKPTIAPQPRLLSKGISVSRRMNSDSELVIPINLNAREIRWRQTFKINSSRDLAYLDITCAGE